MLYEFYGLECPHCERMQKLTTKLMKEFPDIHVERKEVWHDSENMEMVEEFDKEGECGGIPFFYNTETKGWLCGEVTYDEIKKWAGVVEK